MERINRKYLVLNHQLFDEKLFVYEYLRFPIEIDDEHHEFYREEYD